MKTKKLEKVIKLRLPPEFYFVSLRNRVIKNKKKEIEKLKCRKILKNEP